MLVFVDANTRNDKNRNGALLAKYGNPTLQFGLPVFVVLDREGTYLGTRETASLMVETARALSSVALAKEEARRKCVSPPPRPATRS